MNWTEEEYKALAERYREMPDADLIKLAAAPDDLTEIALEVLTKERTRRGLEATETPTQKVPVHVPGEALSPRELDAAWIEFGRNAPPECTFWFQTLHDANEACAVLSESGIAGLIRSDLQPPLVVVRMEDAKQAAVILGRQPLVLDEGDEDPGDFATPLCPQCGSADPILEGIEPVNRWACEACDHEWEDTVDPAG